MSRDEQITALNPQVSSNVRGHTVYNQPASLSVRFFSTTIDFSCAFLLFFLTLRAFHLIPGPRFSLLAILVVEYLVLTQGMKLVVGRTLGQLVWKLDGQGSNQKELLTPGMIGAAIILTSLATTSLFATAHQIVWKHPAMLQAEEWTVPAALPPSVGGPNAEWQVMPFFYALGAWPRVFAGKPVFYTLPYEKGPPTRFVGHIIARWQMPDTRVTFEGPKTPAAYSATRDLLKQCLESGVMSQLFGSWKCFKHRRVTLQRHVGEMNRAVRPKHWNIRWFHVTNPAIPAAEHAQGIYISAQGHFRGQDRAVLITAEGKHQTIILDYSTLSSYELAQKTFEQGLRSLRLSDELNPGKAWADRQLQTIRLEQLKNIDNSRDMAAKLSEIHGMLLAKISVEPKSYDAFFHLAGTSLMLIKQAAKDKSMEDWVAAAKPMIYSALKYAQDIAPQDPRTIQLENLWIEAKKF